ncbi:unnamed protein product [Acanthoscelides obtectus]|uniref:CRAL-TRIO domain-containing protein n=1 Tax=Acanthoscelides obtectus TaxID=200917 RepID=A0A9P0LD25_ACAOB|nr:unnamed protein product [Acanthoscelides obtectus]CAK1620867.1 Alpha-tocopherol transfer protein-like [Acanthoscelides obtectus]
MPDPMNMRNNNSEDRIKKELERVAREELRETESNRVQCLQSLREWVEQNADIENCLTDDNFLLRFLRVKKYSIPMAQQILLKYLNYRKKFREIFYNLDYRDPKINELISKGYIFVSPFRDSKCRRVIIYDLSKFDVSKFNGVDLAKSHAITYETLLDDDETQILGVHHVADVETISPQFLTLFTITEFSYLIKWGEQSFPLRHKEINLLNMPLAVKYVYDFAKSNMSQKLRDRFTVYHSKDSMLEKVDRHCLPKEYGGDVPAKEMIDLWKVELATKRKRLLSFDCMSLLSDQGIMCRKNRQTEDSTGSLLGSFRKLELD